MSWTRHHTIVLTSWKEEAIRAAHAKATELGLLVSPVTDMAMNYYRSFFVAPDGSGEGWQGSEEGWRRRCALIDWLRGQYMEDGGSYVAWVEVQFGDADNEARVTRGSDFDAEGVEDVEEVY